MTPYSELITQLVKGLTRLPGIGPKSAERIVFHVLKEDASYAKGLAEMLFRLKQESFFCKECFLLSENEICHICRDVTRDPHVLCVVEEPKDVIAFEKTGLFRGRYHVLLGALSPLDGIGPGELKIEDLLHRVREKQIQEVVLATNSNTEGETTAFYLSKVLKPLGIKVTRIAKGLPMGSSIEYLDAPTLAQAMEGRRAL